MPSFIETHPLCTEILRHTRNRCERTDGRLDNTLPPPRTSIGEAQNNSYWSNWL